MIRIFNRDFRLKYSQNLLRTRLNMRREVTPAMDTADDPVNLLLGNESTRIVTLSPGFTKRNRASGEYARIQTPPARKL